MGENFMTPCCKTYYALEKKKIKALEKIGKELERLNKIMEGIGGIDK